MRRELDWLAGRARLTPDAVAIIDAEQCRQWSYSEMNSRAAALAEWFISNGVKRGDRIALLSPNAICVTDLLFACGKIGAIFVPLNWRLSSRELNCIMNDCSPVLIGVHSSLCDIMKELELSSIKVFCVNDAAYESIHEKGLSTQLRSVNITEDDPLALIYTGGTTGNPKGAVLSHRSILWNGINTVISWSLTSTDKTLTCMPMFHTGGLNALTIPILMAGGTVVISSDFDPSKAIENINQYHCTVVLFVPTMYHMMVHTKEFQDCKFPSMKIFLSGGAPCPFEIYEQFHKKGLAFKEGYGLTEAGPNNFYIDPADAKRIPGSVGKPMLFNSVMLVKDDGEEAKANEVGELLISGRHAFISYWNNDHATKEALKDGWLHTGDLAKKDENGYYFIVGRKKDMIITGGENVYPLEIEQWISTHPAVKEAAVIGLPDPKWGEVVTAFVVPEHDATVHQDELITYCKHKLGKYKVPRNIFFLKQLPKTHVGKIDKKKLKEFGIEKTQQN